LKPCACDQYSKPIQIKFSSIIDNISEPKGDIIYIYICDADDYEIAKKKVKKAENTSNLSTAESDVDRRTRHDRHKIIEPSDDENVVSKKIKNSQHREDTHMTSSFLLPEVPLRLRSHLKDVTNTDFNCGDEEMLSTFNEFYTKFNEPYTSVRNYLRCH
jgi:hypothetical protein